MNTRISLKYFVSYCRFTTFLLTQVLNAPLLYYDHMGYIDRMEHLTGYKSFLRNCMKSAKHQACLLNLSHAKFGKI